ncbi:MAG: M20 family metallopeptidase [Desulfobacterales bacterium]|nr:M20 family metallopeptidase [Desulfobacterales bacterium]
MSFFEDLETLVKINSFTTNKLGVDAVGKQLCNWCEELGMKQRRFSRELIGDHRLFYSPPATGQKILLVGHLDTVFPPGQFEVYHGDNRWIYGPGVCDMKGGLIVALEALRNIYRTNKKIENIDFFCVSDEETGSDDSSSLTSELCTDYDYILVFEAAGPAMELVIGRKGVGTWTIDITGQAAHAGNNYRDGNDANLEAAHKLQKLVAMTDLDKGSTVNVGKIQGGIGANTISPAASLVVEMRFTSGPERERLLAGLDKIVEESTVPGTAARLSGRLQRDVMEPNTKQAAFVEKIRSISKTPVPTESRGGGSDANITASAGVVTLDGFGPFGDGDHTIHERASKKSFTERILLVTDLFMFHQHNGYLVKED